MDLKFTDEQRMLRETTRDLCLSHCGVDVVRKGDNITLDMPGGVTFAFNSADLNAQFYPVLDKVAATLKEYDKTVSEVAGHTDSTGSHIYNQELSDRRAHSGRMASIDNGISSNRIASHGYGEAYPVASNDTAANRQLNRRVEIILSDDNGIVTPR